MMDKLGRYIKHINNTDVAFYIQNVEEDKEGFNVKGYWITIGVLNDWLSAEDEIKILHKDLSKWRQYSPKEFI